jgi:plasmid stability protein
MLLASRIMTRTTLDLDPTVLGELRARAAREHKSMGQIASETLVRGLAGPDASSAVKGPLAWTSRDLGLPRVDLEDKEALARALDEAR